jgi:general secretion pathway protein N
MTKPEVKRRRAMRLALLLAAALGGPASTAALPTEMSDVDADTQRRADTPSASSLWSAPAAPAPVAVKPSDQPSPAPERARSANPLWAIPLATLSSTRERPIFSPSRRPPPPPVAAVTVAPPPPPPPPKSPRAERPQLSLVGTIVADDDQSFGIFLDQTTRASLRLKIGEDHLGWKLRSVHGREATFERDQQITILSIPQPFDDPAGQTRIPTENAMNLWPGYAPPTRDGQR